MLLAAVDGGEPGRIAHWLAKGADPEAAGPGGLSPLSAAARAGQPGAVQALLRAGASPDRFDDAGMLPLMWAAGSAAPGALECLRLLATPFALAQRRSGAPTLDQPSSFPAGSGGALAFACRAHRPEAVEFLLGAGAGDLPDIDGRLALSLAAGHGCALAIDLLLRAGADPDAVDDRQCTALMAAVDSEREECVQALLAVSDLGRTNDHGETALTMAQSIFLGAESIVALIETEMHRREIQACAGAPTASKLKVRI